MSFSIDCKLDADVANRAWSPANNRRKRRNCSIVNTLSRLLLMLLRMSFTNIMKSKLEFESPCLAPVNESILADMSSLNLIADLTDEYIALSALIILVLILCQFSL